MKILIRGAGDIATGIALRLYRAGMQVVMTDLPAPTAIRRTVCFSQAIILGEMTVEDVTARRAETPDRAEALLAQSENRAEAEALLRGQLLEFEELAAGVIAQAGYDYPVKVELEETRFPTKEYDGFTLPAGDYLALRVLIGAAEGQNWWCVVFPPLCTAAAADVPASAMAGGLSREEVSLITEENTGYVLKFKAVEWWESLREKFSD